MNDDVDLAIVGGGPAGSACALAAARAGSSVALFEAQLVVGDKPCGEGLMPTGVDALRELELHELITAGRPFDRLRYVLPGVEPVELTLPRPGLALDRPRLARGLEEALARASGVTRHVGRVEVERILRCGTAVGFHVQSRTASLRARVLVAADGLNGKTAPWLRPGIAAGTVRDANGRVARLGVRARYETTEPLDAVEIHFTQGVELYLTPLPGNRINLAVLVSGHRSEAGGCEAILTQALAEHPRAAARLSRRVTEPEARVLAYRIPPLVAAAGTFLVGDAGGGIDPILGCGVTLALESGILAARAARTILEGDASGRPEFRYAREYRERTRRRRALASFLLGLSKHPRIARGAVRMLRLTPGILESFLSVAAGRVERRPMRGSLGMAAAPELP